MTSGSPVSPSVLCALILGTVSRFIGWGVGFARLVLVSSWKVVDMGVRLASARCKGKASLLARPLKHCRQARTGERAT